MTAFELQTLRRAVEDKILKDPDAVREIVWRLMTVAASPIDQNDQWHAQWLVTQTQTILADRAKRIGGGQ